MKVCLCEIEILLQRAIHIYTIVFYMSQVKIAENYCFPLVEIYGDAEERGFQHGFLLKERIHKNIAFYRKVIRANDSDVQDLAFYFGSVIRAFNREYIVEIDAMARGAEVDPVWIYMLNARSEIIDTFLNECTSFFFRPSGFLCQNWDWAEEAARLAVLLKITKSDGRKILTLTEPGIISKIGFNSDGVGVTINFMLGEKKPKGVPVHVLLRAVLDSADATYAGECIQKYGTHTTGNLLVADKEGACFNFELTGEKVFMDEPEGGFFIHTNHYLHLEMKNPNRFAASLGRFRRATDLLEGVKDYSIDDAKKVLTDTDGKEDAICRIYKSNPVIGNVGTIASLIMNLKKGEMFVQAASSQVSGFENFVL